MSAPVFETTTEERSRWLARLNDVTSDVAIGLRGTNALRLLRDFAKAEQRASEAENEIARLRPLADEAERLREAAAALVTFIRASSTLNSRAAGMELTRLCREIDGALAQKAPANAVYLPKKRTIEDVKAKVRKKP